MRCSLVWRTPDDAYVGNDPLNFSDPLGLCAGRSEVIGGVFVGTACKPQNGPPITARFENFGGGGGGGGGANEGGEGARQFAAEQCFGPRITLSFGPQGTVQAGGLGGSLQASVFVSVPLNAPVALFLDPANALRGFQFGGTLQSNQLIGPGQFVGWGAGYGASYSSRALDTGQSFATGYHGEANLGFGEAYGGSVDLPANPRTGALNGGAAVASGSRRIGNGFGAAVGGGTFQARSVSTAPVGCPH